MAQTLPVWTAPTEPTHQVLLLYSQRAGAKDWTYTLRCDGHLLAVRSRSYVAEAIDWDNPEELRAVDRAQLFDLEIIQTMITRLRFGDDHQAYIINGGKGNYRMVYRRYQPGKIHCIAWTTLIEESDIKITKWCTNRYREGVWRGQAVDLSVDPGTGGEEWEAIQREIDNYQVLSRIDLCFEVFGLIVRNGDIVGIATEPAVGRPVEYSDRATVYSAVATLQRHGVVHRAIQLNTMLVTDKGLRFLSLESCLIYPREDVVGLNKAAQFYHWGRLERLFKDLLAGVPGPKRPGDINYYLIHRKTPHIQFIIPRLPSIPRELGLDIASLFFQQRPENYATLLRSGKLNAVCHAGMSMLPTRPLDAHLPPPKDDHESTVVSRQSTLMEGNDWALEQSRYVEMDLKINRCHPYKRSSKRSRKDKSSTSSTIPSLVLE